MDIKKLISTYAITISEESVFLSDPEFIKAQNTLSNRNNGFTTFKDNVVAAKDNLGQEQNELGMKMIYG